MGERTNQEAVMPDELEARIDHEAMLLSTAQTPAERSSAWLELTRLVALRSPAPVAQVESESAAPMAAEGGL
jgi:hypothetical protein